MNWADIIDQERIVYALSRAVQQNRVAHAYLFYGPHGTGKRAVALQLAKLLQCEQRNDKPCGRCLACTKMRRMVHPDLHMMLPQPKGVDEEDVAERLQLLGQQPYAETDFRRRPSLEDPEKSSNKQAIYSIDRIRELHRMMSYTPSEGSYKVTILTGADQMRRESANAFLKLLEEPTPRTVLILTTDRPDKLLPTISSRCQQMRFVPLSPQAIQEALVEREEVASDTAAMVAHMADGSYTRAIELLNNEQLKEARSLALEFFRQAYAMQIDSLLDLTSKISNMGREQTKGLLQLMLTWTRDLLLYRTTEVEDLLVNVDQQTAIVKFCENVPEARIAEMVEVIQDAQEMIRRNVHTELAFIALAQALSRLMHGQSTGKALYHPLANGAKHLSR